MTVDEFAQIFSGNRRVLAHAISEVEDASEDAHALLAALYARTGQAHVIGITGAPGSGKSTLASALCRAFRRAGNTVAIIAVDPTSPFTGGALLGDRVRMRDLAGDPGVFIRSMATRGGLGGLARATSDVILVLDAAGFDKIIVETVGVGQAEVDIASAAHTTIVVEAPGMGDEIQAIKAGVLEIADVFVVNKADRDDSDRTVMALQMMQNTADPAGYHNGGGAATMLTPSSANCRWQPPILKTIATGGEGIDLLIHKIESHRTYLRASGLDAQRDRSRAAASLAQILREQLMATLRARLPDGREDDLIEAVARREIDPYTAAAQLQSIAGLAR